MNSNGWSGLGAVWKTRFGWEASLVGHFACETEYKNAAHTDRISGLLLMERMCSSPGGSHEQNRQTRWCGYGRPGRRTQRSHHHQRATVELSVVFQRSEYERCE